MQFLSAPQITLILLLCGIVTLFSTILTAYTLFRTKTARFWKEERDAALAHVLRVDNALKEATDELTILRNRTDVTKLSQEHAGIINAISKLVEEEEEGHVKIVTALENNTRSLMAFQSQMAGVFETQLEQFRMINQLLNK